VNPAKYPLDNRFNFLTGNGLGKLEYLKLPLELLYGEVIACKFIA